MSKEQLKKLHALLALFQMEYGDSHTSFAFQQIDEILSDALKEKKSMNSLKIYKINS